MSLYRAMPAASTSWLVSLPSCCFEPTNKQIVPRLCLPPSSLARQTSRDICHTQLATARPAVTAAMPAAAATAAATTHAGGYTAAEAEDFSTARARLYALYDFVSKHKRLPSMQDVQQGVAVGQWAEKCRQMQQQQQGLEPELVAALQSIPGWTWQSQVSVLSEGFQENVQELAAYAERFGRPPKRTKRATTESKGSKNSQFDIPTEAQHNRAADISKQLVEQRKRGVLTQAQLDAVSQQVQGWTWDMRIRSPPLEQLIAELQAFHKQHGRLPKSDERLQDGFLIGDWCSSRRREYSLGQLELDVAAALETQVPGWLWNRLDSVFESNLEALAGYVGEHGRMPTQRETWGGVRVGAWCNKRRLQYKAGILAADRVAALESIPGWWWSCDDMPL